MIRTLLINGIIVLALAWTASGTRLVAATGIAGGACSAVQSEPRAESERVPDSPSVRPAFVAPETLSRMSAGARIVDVRRHSGLSGWQPEGVLALSFLELRVLAGRSQDPIYVFGNGYDDNRIARRIARWKSSESERVRVVRFGAAGIALAHSESINESELKKLLVLPAQEVVSAGRGAGGLVVWFGSSVVPASVRTSLPEMLDAGSQSPGEIEQWIGERKPKDDVTIVLVGDDSARVAEVAFDASVALGRPVFYISGSPGQIERQIVRHSRLLQGRRRVGEVPCG